MGLHLLACPACSRHVRAAEAACPFCGEALSDAFRASPAPTPPRARMARAALVALGAGAVAASAACGGAETTGTGTGKEDGGQTAQHDAGADVGVVGAKDAGPPDTGYVVTPPYGDPPAPDAGETPSDAGFLDDVVLIGPYGIAPVGGY